MQPFRKFACFLLTLFLLPLGRGQTAKDFSPFEDTPAVLQGNSQEDSTSSEETKVSSFFVNFFDFSSTGYMFSENACNQAIDASSFDSERKELYHQKAEELSSAIKIMNNIVHDNLDYLSLPSSKAFIAVFQCAKASLVIRRSALLLNLAGYFLPGIFLGATMIYYGHAKHQLCHANIRLLSSLL